MLGVLDTINKSETHDYERNLSPMILKGNQMVYSWNQEIISLAFCQNSNNFPSLKAREIIRILTKRKWNYFLISLVTIWLHIQIMYYSLSITEWTGVQTQKLTHCWNLDKISHQLCPEYDIGHQTRVVQRADNFIQWISCYPADKMYCKFFTQSHT